MSYIDKDATLAAIAQKAKDELADVNHYFREGVQLAVDVVEGMTEPKEAENGSMPCPDARNSHDRTTDDCISRKAAISATEWAMSDSPSITREDWNAVVEWLEGVPSVQPDVPDEEKISDALLHIYRNIGTNTSAEGVVAIKYYIAEIWRELYGEEGPIWLKN